MRSLLSIVAVAAVAGILGGCAAEAPPAPAPTTINKTVEVHKSDEKTVVTPPTEVHVDAPAAPAAAPTVQTTTKVEATPGQASTTTTEVH
jgi:hypothetical protein